MIQPSLETDAAPPERQSRGLIFLAGAIKWWWLSKCSSMNCGFLGETDAERCPACGSHIYKLWDTPEHKDYVAWRNFVRAALVNAGFLTYAPHEAFKGTWDPRAQAVNDAAIAASDRMLVLSPQHTITDGTDEEVRYAHKVGTNVIYLPPDSVNSLQWQIVFRA